MYIVGTWYLYYVINYYNMQYQRSSQYVSSHVVVVNLIKYINYQRTLTIFVCITHNKEHNSNDIYHNISYCYLIAYSHVWNHIKMRWIECFSMGRSTTATKFIEQLRNYFSTFGSPDTTIQDIITVVRLSRLKIQKIS